MSAERWRQLLGWSQLLCGALGIVVIPWAAHRTATITEPSAYTAGALIYVGLTTVAGVGLLRRADWGVPLSTYVQIPQVLWLATPSFAFKFVCGLMLLIQLTPGNLSFRAGFEASAWIGRNPGPAAHLYVVNLFPLLALRGLWRLRRQRLGAAEEPSAELTAEGPSAGSAA